MKGYEDDRHLVLIVSGSEQFDSFVRKSLGGLPMVESGRSAATARRSILERYYDLVVINAPLPDETGELLAADVSRQCSASVLLVTSQERYEEAQERLIDLGVMVLPKPVSRGQMDKALHFLSAVQKKIHQLEKRIQALEEKAEELRIVARAKLLLVEQRQMSEDEAHRYIGKQAMDNGVSRRRIAERILDELE